MRKSHFESRQSDQLYLIIPMSSAHRENNATTPPGEDAVKTNQWKTHSRGKRGAVLPYAPLVKSENLSLELENDNIKKDEESETNPETSDLDLPIAVRKGRRACTQHPLNYFLSYQ